MTALRIVVGVLLVGHGLGHLLFVVPDVPFAPERSWLVPPAARQQVAHAVMGATVLAFTLVALALWGVPGLTDAWPLLTFIACGLSVALLVAYWNVQLLLGIAIDLALVAAAVLQPDWVTGLVNP